MPEKLWEEMEKLLPKPKRSRKGGPSFSSDKNNRGGDFLYFENGVSVESGAGELRFGEYASPAFSEMGEARGFQEAVAGGVDDL